MGENVGATLRLVFGMGPHQYSQRIIKIGWAYKL